MSSQIMSAMGEDGMKRFAELSAAALHSALRANAEPETDQWH